MCCLYLNLCKLTEVQLNIYIQPIHDIFSEAPSIPAETTLNVITINECCEGCGGSLVESIAVDWRVVGSNPALAAT